MRHDGEQHPRQRPKRPRRRHLRRLDRIFISTASPLFFLTVCVKDRSSVLAHEDIAVVLTDAWADALPRHGWLVGRYVIMPDHIHFFAAPEREAARDLASFLRYWKRATGMRIRASVVPTFAWQREFFDHLLRSGESYSEKSEYVRCNPVRVGLVQNADEWPFQGRIHEIEW